MQHSFLGRTKSVAGTALVGLGIFILCKNLDQAETQLNHFFSTPREMLGVVPTVILAAWRVLQAYASDHQRFVQGLFRHALVMLWPLVLVVVGTSLSREAFPGDGNATTKKDRKIVDFTVRRSTLK